jgi:hypothetical protein
MKGNRVDRPTQVNAEQIEATLKDGMLAIRVPALGGASLRVRFPARLLVVVDSGHGAHGHY